jgi:GLPGLI family protein
MKYMKYILSLILLVHLATGYEASAQTQFITTGKIEFEQKVNMHKRVGEGMWADEMKRKLPQFSTTYFDLRFDENESTYRAGKEVADDPWKKMWGGGDDGNDVIYNNFDSGHTISTKQVFEKLYRLDDSLLNIEWKIGNDTREIAGFTCRKAVGKFFDSLYVVAFYTEEIITPGGPGNYTGLPGMILGIAIPRFSTTVFATKLELTTPKQSEISPLLKGKKVTRKDMFAQVKEVYTRWNNDEWQKYFWQTVL